MFPSKNEEEGRMRLSSSMCKCELKGMQPSNMASDIRVLSVSTVFVSFSNMWFVNLLKLFQTMDSMAADVEEPGMPGW